MNNKKKGKWLVAAFLSFCIIAFLYGCAKDENVNATTLAREALQPETDSETDARYSASNYISEIVSDHVEMNSREDITAVDEETTTAEQDNYLGVCITSSYGFGPVVETNAGLFYWKYNENSFEDVALFGRNSLLPGSNNQLIWRLDGKEIVIAEGDNAGDICVCNDIIGYCTNQNTIKTYNTTNHSTTNIGNGTLLGTDGHNIVWESDNWMLVTDPFSGATTSLFSGGTFLTIHDGRIYYALEEEDGLTAKAMICSVSVDGNDFRPLCSVNTEDFYSYDDMLSAEICQVCFPVVDNEERIYFSYGVYAGNYNMFASGAIYHTDVSGSSLYAVREYWKTDDGYEIDLENGDNGFFVADDGSISLKSFPGASSVSLNMPYRVVDGEVYAISAANGTERLIVPEEDYYKFFESQIENPDEVYIGITDVSYNEEHIYFTATLKEHAPEADWGWRYAYRRIRSIMFEKDVESGNIDVIYDY